MGIICEIPVISGVKSNVGVSVAADTRILVDKNAELNFTLELPEFVYAGIKTSECAGRAFVTADGATIGEFPLNYTEDVKLANNSKLSAWDRIKRAWFIANKYGFVFQGTD